MAIPDVSNTNSSCAVDTIGGIDDGQDNDILRLLDGLFRCLMRIELLLMLLQSRHGR